MKHLLCAVIACTFLMEASAQKIVRPFITGYGDVFEVAATKEATVSRQRRRMRRSQYVMALAINDRAFLLRMCAPQ